MVDIQDELAKYKADCGVLVAFGKIVPESIIKIFPRGIINVHPSLLPKHRGPTPLESVILAGETETGVSIMSLVKAMDAGPVYVQETVTLKGSETKQELADTLGGIGSKLIHKHLPVILNGSLKPKPQIDEEATYDALLTKLDGAIDWNLPAEVIERQIRAYAVWPGSRQPSGKREVLVVAAESGTMTGIPGEVFMHDKELIVFCGLGSINITSLKPAGKTEMTAASFIAGYKPKT